MKGLTKTIQASLETRPVWFYVPELYWSRSKVGDGEGVGVSVGGRGVLVGFSVGVIVAGFEGVGLG